MAAHRRVRVPGTGVILASLLAAASGGLSAAPTAAADEAGSKALTEATAVIESAVRFDFHYRFKLQGIPADAEQLRIWVPAPMRDPLQHVQRTRLEAPVAARETSDPIHGNRYLYFEVTHPASVALRWDITWNVTRRQSVNGRFDGTDRDALARYLQPNRLVPVDETMRQLVSEADLPPGSDDARARRLSEFVLTRMTYSKHALGWGRGDARWACDSRYGNCTDYHALFIAMSRTSEIPARFEMGFLLPDAKDRGTIGGYHCWASFYDGPNGWRSVDISEADKRAEPTDEYFGYLHARRVHFTTGRDLLLVPQQKALPLNYFIYPHAEVDGRVHADMQRTFRFDGLEVIEATPPAVP